jgi:hypothetical protein
VDARGRVVGINISALARGAALTVLVTTVEQVAEQLLARGRVACGYMGVGTQPMRLPAAARAATGTEGGWADGGARRARRPRRAGRPAGGRRGAGAGRRRGIRRGPPGLGISSHTAKSHVAAVLVKLNASTRAEVVAVEARLGVILV